MFLKRIVYIVSIMLLASTISAKENKQKFTIQKSIVQDGVVFESNTKDSAMTLRLVGPEGFSSHLKIPVGEMAFVDINNMDGEMLVDGLYTYELKAMPNFTISREESAKMSDRNSLKNTSSVAVSPVSGVFRVLNGQVVDDQLEEFSSVDSGERK